MEATRSRYTARHLRKGERPETQLFRSIEFAVTHVISNAVSRHRSVKASSIADSMSSSRVSEPLKQL
jgi:hypothetical protein